MTHAILTTAARTSISAPAQHRSGFRYVVWGVGIIVIGGMLIAAMLPSLCRSRETANRVKCAANLKAISQAMSFYAKSHGGQYPPSLASLLSVEDITADSMICPSSADEKPSATAAAEIIAELTAAETGAAGHKHCLSYVYAGQALTEKSATEVKIVAYEPLVNHGGDGVNVLFGDGHVDWISKGEWPKTAADAGIAIAPRPGG